MQPIFASQVIIKDKVDDFPFWKNLFEAIKKPITKDFLKLTAIPFLASLLWNTFKPDSKVSIGSFFLIEIIDYFVNAIINFPVYIACLNHFYFGESLKFKMGKREIDYLFWDVMFFVFPALLTSVSAVLFYKYIYQLKPDSLQTIIPAIAIFFRPFTSLLFVLIGLNVAGIGKIKKSILIGMKLYKELLIFVLLLTAVNRCGGFLAEYAYLNSIVWSLWTVIWSIYSFYITGVKAAFMTSALKTKVNAKETL